MTRTTTTTMMIMMMTVALHYQQYISFVHAFQIPSFSSSSSIVTTTLTLTRSSSSSSTERSTTRSRSTYLNLTPLPKDIAPFDKSASKGRDIQGEIRKLATTAFEKALVLDGTTNTSNNNNPLLFELEFPPLLGGEKSKSQFDDFDST